VGGWEKFQKENKRVGDKGGFHNISCGIWKGIV
jgi:hypothetical protein